MEVCALRRSTYTEMAAPLTIILEAQHSALMERATIALVIRDLALMVPVQLELEITPSTQTAHHQRKLATPCSTQTEVALPA
jgi:hypothetical protein